MVFRAIIIEAAIGLGLIFFSFIIVHCSVAAEVQIHPALPSVARHLEDLISAVHRFAGVGQCLLLTLVFAVVATIADFSGLSRFERILVLASLLVGCFWLPELCLWTCATFEDVNGCAVNFRYGQYDWASFGPR